MFNVVLFEPEIPSNTGNIGRTCVVTGSRLHLIGLLGFSLGDDMLRRAGLGYWHSLDVTTYAGWEEFLAQNGLGETDERLHLLTKKARKTYAQATYADGDFLVFGKESTGLPEELLARAASRCERIPMLPDATTLKDAGEWAARVGREQSHEALRQDVCGNFVDPDDYRISALNLSNSAAIVLYEALRQTDFQGM
ncbi:RNA methyltransferase [Parolsenella catena]|uniref:Putative tRNA (cytidine(34)-2'-O)-methyltransferase n=1 Tax=Parolsenella catena TaxID=2003188 RepID=A0A3G9JXC5_9ACTN|nr:tRNA (cytidine(34)-2'-O)-methyltransferase [Parolsenella catena]BBH50137.1 RNA methyltransferase [Parolsenella catena]